MSSIERAQSILNDINQKLSEVGENSEARQFLLKKKSILNTYLEKIMNEADINKYEFELYLLHDKALELREKIRQKENRPRDDDEDVKALKDVNERMSWIRETKLGNVMVLQLQKKPSTIVPFIVKDMDTINKKNLR